MWIDPPNSPTNEDIYNKAVDWLVIFNNQSYRVLENYFDMFAKYGVTDDHLRLDLWRQFQWRHFCCPRNQPLVWIL